MISSDSSEIELGFSRKNGNKRERFISDESFLLAQRDLPFDRSLANSFGANLLLLALTFFLIYFYFGIFRFYRKSTIYLKKKKKRTYFNESNIIDAIATLCDFED